MDALRRFLTERGLTQQQAAEMFGVSQGLVSHWLNGRCSISAELCRAVEIATAGAVTRADLRPDLFGPVPVARPLAGDAQKAA